MRPILLLALLFMVHAVNAQTARIVVDGSYEDWQSVAPTHEDALEDRIHPGVDFGALWTSRDERSLLLRIELHEEILIQEGNSVELLIDTDADEATGTPRDGLGAEIVWSFGQRTGLVFSGGQESVIGHHELGLITAPTVSSNQFEIAISLSAHSSTRPLLAGDIIRLALVDSASGDRLPDQGGIDVQLSGPAPPPSEAIPISRHQPDDIRFLSYNILAGGFSDPARRPHFSRILAAINPDVIGFQEAGGQSVTDVRSYVHSVLGDSNAPWYAHQEDGGLIVVSRFPILWTYRIEGSRSTQSNSAALIDTTPRWGVPTLLINAHPPCCRNDDARQFEMDAIAAFLRDVKPGASLGLLSVGTPIVMLGDMNMVGAARQIDTLLGGDIVNEAIFGTAPPPDWDGSPLADLQPLVSSLPMVFTWYNPESSFHPGRLDFVMYSDSVLEPQNRYVLFTPSMAPEVLASAGLDADDTILASDHLPVVGDFRVRKPVETSSVLQQSLERTKILSYPNPMRSEATILFTTSETGRVRLSITDVLGREVALLVDEYVQPGTHEIQWHPGQLPAGTYFVHVTGSGGQESVTSMIRLP